ncbi:hypothetical protein EYF80_063549 [Liparis tanakae]|uniref:Uncharacterized protein n=1 Tax=Liparis tanakae TaxID=230148 RepID=A0A4Z2EC64_9TELE|nr:hypothetical protein EYF80_063549 [Liparis tanakae]
MRGGAAEMSTIDRDSTEEGTVLIRDSLVATDWCHKTTFLGRLQLPTVLSMDEEDQKLILKEMHDWDGDQHEESPAEHFTFVFSEQKDYDSFLSVDNRNLKVFARFGVEH